MMCDNRLNWLQSEVYVVEGLYDDRFAIDYRKTTVSEKLKNGILVFESEQVLEQDDEDMPF